MVKVVPIRGIYLDSPTISFSSYILDYPAFTFCNTLVYYTYTSATLAGTILSRQEARQENVVARAHISETFVNTTNRSERKAHLKESSTFNSTSQAQKRYFLPLSEARGLHIAYSLEQEKEPASCI
jgi:hypothetical protein